MQRAQVVVEWRPDVYRRARSPSRAVRVAHLRLAFDQGEGRESVEVGQEALVYRLSPEGSSRPEEECGYFLRGRG